MPTIAGIIMLVPGGYGLRGMFALAIDGDIEGGVTLVFTVLLIATELAVAVILGNIIIPPRGGDKGAFQWPRFLTRKTFKRWRNKLRGVDETVGVDVTRTVEGENI
eukprot:CAMPEP_0117001782 /NCGR_PEP_ID=MMETSP0472-20121206/3673_1 /TAXON_ID=693140 ORGANISM="Tiarina fusus, Strain LIS" /NCGR_SAMPLE_ID=MMETSP0472 /ASSEMBLY_ACC=CAM_ASM_000603 /LENGTH=105 /DNA_ID=CAMNT_0004701917 /DNA_START=294 /DNA_END=611 /DNA_ORIENTATION=+